MSKKFRVFSRLGDKLQSLEVNPAAVLRRAALPAGLLGQSRVLLTTEELFALWRSIGEVSGDPAIGLKLGTEEQVERYDSIAFAALCTHSLGDALQRMARYKALTCPEELRIENDGTECRVQFRWLLAREMEPEVLVDVCFAWMMSIARRGTGIRLSPLRVELARPAAERERMEEFFGCGVRFEAEANTLVFRSADLARTFVTHNAELLAMIAPQLDREISERHSEQTFPERVRVAIQQRLAGQRPSVQEIARELHMSSRTLQRRLQESGSSFQQVLEAARHELACHYLAHSPLELNETAYLLGYEDANSFVRAFHEWEGVPPAHWRQTQRCGVGEIGG